MHVVVQATEVHQPVDGLPAMQHLHKIVCSACCCRKVDIRTHCAAVAQG